MKKLKRVSLLLFAFLITYVFPVFSEPPSGYIKTWEDTFETFNPDNWTIGLIGDNGDKVPGAAGRYLLNNQYCGYITEDDTYVANGYLYLRNQKRNYTGTDPSGNYSYTSSWVMSMHKVYFNGSETNAYLEVRAQFPPGDKVWPAIWLIAEDLQWGPEWDLWEYFGYRGDVGYDVMGCHLYTYTWSSSWIYDFDRDFDCETWHTYGFEWTENQAIWTLDGQVVRTLNASSVPQWVDENMYIVLNNGQRTDSPDQTTTWPNYLIIDYIRLYEKTGPTPTPAGTSGDVNDDGIVDIVDALLVAQYYVGLTSSINTGSADVNCDNTIDIVDALLIAQYYVGLISSLHC